MLDEEKYTKNMFSTTNLWFACYLKSKGLDLVHIADDGSNLTPLTPNTYLFVFRIHKNDPFIIQLQDEWDNSRHCSEIKRILHSYKLLKFELGRHKHSNELNNI